MSSALSYHLIRDPVLGNITSELGFAVQSGASSTLFKNLTNKQNHPVGSEIFPLPYLFSHVIFTFLHIFTGSRLSAVLMPLSRVV